VAQHRVEFMQRRHLGFDRVDGDAHFPGHFHLRVFFVRNEFMQRRIEQANRDAVAFHGFQNAVEVFALHREQFGQRFFAAFQVVGQDHFAHGLDAVAFKEHVFGAAKADALRAEIAGDGRVARRVGIRPDAQLLGFIGPLHDDAEVAGKLRGDRFHFAQHHFAGGAVQRNVIAFGNDVSVDLDGFLRIADFEIAAAGNAAFAHAAGDDRRMRGHAAALRQHALRRRHAF